MQPRHKGKLTSLPSRYPNGLPVRELWDTMSAIAAKTRTYAMAYSERSPSEM